MVRRTLLFAGWLACAAAGPRLIGQQLHERPASSLPGAVATSSIMEVHWTLSQLNGSAVRVDATATQPYIYLQTEGDKLSGSGGCNRLFGSYDLSGNSLQFHSVASTRMACGGNSTRYEAALLEALRQTTSFRVSGEVLELRLEERVLARFQAEKKP